MGFPSVGITSALSAPASRMVFFQYSAAFTMSALCSGFALMDGMRSSPKSSSMKRSLLASMYLFIVSILFRFFTRGARR